jgi:peroxiredoxin
MPRRKPIPNGGYIILHQVPEILDEHWFGSPIAFRKTTRIKLFINYCKAYPPLPTNPENIIIMKKSIFTLLLFVSLGLTTFAQTGLPAGNMAPAFTAKDNSGKTVDLKALLKTHTAVVVLFYRGQWCPYCNKHLQQLQDSLQLLTAKNIYVVAITPETSEAIGKTVEKTHASFSLVHDEGAKIMKDYKVDYVMDQAMVTKYKGYGVDLEKNNGNTDHMLPVPATYIIDKSGKITFVHFDKDYTKRVSVSTILGKV